MTKNKDTKRELFIFSTVDYFSLKEHFEDMARKGWLIDKIKYSFAVYKKIEPSDLTFSVDIYPPKKLNQTALSFYKQQNYTLFYQLTIPF